MEIVEDRFWIKKIETKASLGKEELLLFRIGLRKGLAEKIGPTVFLEGQVLPGQHLAAGSLLYVVESTKAAIDLDAPFALEVERMNSQLERSPHLLFEDPQGEGWLLEAWMAKSLEDQALLFLS